MVHCVILAFDLVGLERLWLIEKQVEEKERDVLYMEALYEAVCVC